MSGDNDNAPSTDFERLGKRLKFFRATPIVAAVLCDIAKSLLEVNGQDGVDDVKAIELNIEALPSAQDIESRAANVRPGSYPVILQRDVCDFYPAFPNSDPPRNFLSSSQTNHRSLIVYVRLATVYGLTPE